MFCTGFHFMLLSLIIGKIIGSGKYHGSNWKYYQVEFMIFIRYSKLQGVVGFLVDTSLINEGIWDSCFISLEGGVFLETILHESLAWVE